MATPKIVADFETQLSSAVSVGDTSFTLSSVTDDDGNTLPAGLYYFTVENGSSNKEYLAGTLSGSTVSSVVSVSRQGTETSGSALAHRVGAGVIISDWMTYKKYMDEIALVSAPDADTNTKGVVEAATLAEVRAGTGTGGSGAALVPTCDVLDDLPTQDEKAAIAGTSGSPSASNKFVTADDVANDGTSAKIIRANGTDLPIGITQATKGLDISGATTDLASTGTTEYDIYSYTVAAGTLGTGNAIRVKIYISNFTQASSAGTLTFRMKYGTTTIASAILAEHTVSATPVKGHFEMVLTANAATNAQTGFMDFDVRADDLDLDSFGAKAKHQFRAGGTATEDSTGALDLKLTMQHSQSAGLTDFVPAGIVTELIS